MKATVAERDEAPWVRAPEALSRLAKARASADAEEGRWLLAALRSAVHVHLGFGGFSEYVEHSFGYSRRVTREKLRVAEALEGLPALAGALEEGVVNWSAVRELTRVVVPATEREWLEVAKGKTARQVKELVAGQGSRCHARAAVDESTAGMAALEVEAETFAVFRQAMGELRRRAGSALEDDALLLEMVRAVLGSARDEGRAAYQLALTVCAECDSGWQDAGADVVAIGSEVVEMARCDAQHLGRVDEAALAAGDARQPERAAAQPLGTSDAQPLGHDQQSLGETVQPANAAAPTHMGRERHGAHSAHRAHRATQDVPPAVRTRGVAPRPWPLPGARLPQRDLSRGASHRAARGGGRTPCRESLDGVRRASPRFCIAANQPLRAMRRARAFGMPTAPSMEVSPTQDRRFDEQALFGVARLGLSRGGGARGARGAAGARGVARGAIQDWLRAALQWLTPVQEASARA